MFRHDVNVRMHPFPDGNIEQIHSRSRTDSLRII